VVTHGKEFREMILPVLLRFPATENGVESKVCTADVEVTVSDWDDCVCEMEDEGEDEDEDEEVWVAEVMLAVAEGERGAPAEDRDRVDEAMPEVGEEAGVGDAPMPAMVTAPKSGRDTVVGLLGRLSRVTVPRTRAALSTMTSRAVCTTGTKTVSDPSCLDMRFLRAAAWRDEWRIRKSLLCEPWASPSSRDPAALERAAMIRISSPSLHERCCAGSLRQSRVIPLCETCCLELEARRWSAERFRQSQFAQRTGWIR